MTGRAVWAVPGAHIPLGSTGPEPQMTSRDQLALLNPGVRDAAVELTVHSAEEEPLGPFRCTVPAERLRVVRLNDLIDPCALLLDTPYAVTITTDVPVVVQFTRCDTRDPNLAITGGLAFPAERQDATGR